MNHLVAGFIKRFFSPCLPVQRGLSINTIRAYRDAVKLLLYNTGARVSEIVALELDDLRLDDSTQSRLQGKGGKQPACSLWPETATVLNANSTPITRFGIRYVTRKYGMQAQASQPGIKSKTVNPHTIRYGVTS